MIYRFGPYEVDEAAGELRKDGEPVRIQPKPLALLALLIRERARVVPIDELLDALWPDTAVTQSSLTRAVSLARSAIGDSGRTGRLRSYTRRGYRFHGDVVERGRDDAAKPEPGEAEELEAGQIPFVGRSEALERLRGAWGEVVGGAGAIALVSGPAGIGKTRLVETFCGEVRRRGGLVLRGRALEEEGEPAFWVWAQILRALHETDPEALRVPGLAETGELAALMPELGSGSSGGASELPAEQRRFVFFDAVARCLASAARVRPLLVFFEDVHWADPASLRLLEHLAFDLANTPVLIAATVREEPGGREHPGSRTVSVLRRQDHCKEIALDALGEDEVEVMLARMTGRPAPEIARRLVARTAGIPLYLREAMRRLTEQGGLEDPEQLRLAELRLPGADWIGKSLDELGEACDAVVGAASVLGRAFAVPLLSGITERERGEVLDALDEAVHAGVVETDPDSPARFRFVHDLFREAAYARLAPGQRARLHHRAAQRLERQHGEDRDRIVAELAHHYHQGLAVGDPEHALRAAVEAAERAISVCAYEKAALHYDWARAALEHGESVDRAKRLEVLLGQGEACRLAGEGRRRREVFSEAAELARAQDDADALATAAIGHCEVSEWGVRDDPGRALLEEALAGFDAIPPDVEARILTRLACLDAVFHQEIALPRARRAVELGRKLAAPEILEGALYALHFALGGPDAIPERGELLAEHVEAARASRDPDAAVISILDVACDRLTLGDLAGARELRAQAERVAGEPPHPRTLWHRGVYDTAMALLEGRLGEVAGRAEAALAIGRRVEHPYARPCYEGHLAYLAFERGDYEGVLRIFDPAMDRRGGNPMHWVRTVTARAQLALGREDEARAIWSTLSGKGFDDVPRNIRWIATMVELGHLAAELGDDEAAPALLDILRPIEAQHGVLPMAINYGGPVAFALARLHAQLGRADEADELYEEALEAASAVGARPSEARVRLAHGAFRARRGERSRGRELLAAARDAASELGMRDVAARAEERLAS